MSLKKILIVEKDALQAYLLQVKFGETGWSVRLTDEPEAALMYCEQESFDAAIINYKYSGNVNGFELAKLLLDRYDLPSLMITAIRQKELVKDPRFSAQQALLFKPYRLLECGRRLRALLTGR